MKKHLTIFLSLFLFSISSANAQTVDETEIIDTETVAAELSVASKKTFDKTINNMASKKTKAELEYFLKNKQVLNKRIAKRVNLKEPKAKPIDFNDKYSVEKALREQSTFGTVME